MKSELPSHWGTMRKDRRALTARQRARLGRPNWFVRMAALGFVPAPDAKANKAALIAAVFPDLFPSAQLVSPHINRERWDLLEPNGFSKKFSMSVLLPGKQHIVPVLVNAKNAVAATDLLQSALPEGTKIMEN
jgi:hypothetical protein